MLVMGDDIKATALAGLKLDVEAGYVDGNWPDFAQLVAQSPTLKHLAIDATAKVERADCLDIEAGDATPGDFGPFCARWVRWNTAQPVAYAQASRVHQVIMATWQPRYTYFIWSAHYTNVAHICSSATCWPESPIPWVADMTQWTDHSGAWDQSLVQPYVFDVPTPTLAPAPAPPPPSEATVILPVLNQGGRGDPVRSAQACLNVYDNAGLATDGDFGPLTLAAVETFQRSRGLAVDGVVGAHTWGALLGAPQ